MPVLERHFDLKGRSLLTLNEFNPDELHQILVHARECKRLKKARVFNEGLRRRNICGIFLKPSGRTSTAFVVASHDEGAHLQFFPAENIRFGYKESVADLARLIGGIFDGIVFRGFEHSVAVELARHAGIPVWNGLTDDHHPTQLLADVMTFQEEFGELNGLKVAYVGDGRNNMATSLIIGALKLGYDLRIVGPKSLHPSNALMDRIRADTPERRGSVLATDDIEEGVGGADVIYTDVWASMGEEDKTEERIALLRPYRVTSRMMDMTGSTRSIFMHCLPAFHDLETEVARKYPEIREVEDDVFQGSQSRVFAQAENRMHTAKALMLETVA